MDIGEKIRLTITDTNEIGSGVARHKGAVVFVPSLVAGDTAVVRITDIKKNYAIGKAEELLSPSESRQVPVCNNFEKCGGCTLCHVTYGYENIIKQSTVRAALRRAGLRYDNVGETVSASSRTAYRNKVTLHYAKDAHLLGLYSEETNDVVQFDDCALLPDGFNEIIRHLCRKSSLLDECSAQEIILKSSEKDKIIVIIKSSGDIGEIKKELLSAFPSVRSVSSFPAENEYVYAAVNGLEMRFSALGFRQVNDEAFALLLDVVKALADCGSHKYCADLYCGSGVIGFSLAASYPDSHFYGIEINEKSVEDARYNADKNVITNTEFFCGDAASFKQRIPNDKLPSLIVVDPPRAGLSQKMRRELISLSPETVIYVSCNPQTMARDAKELSAVDYEIQSVTPVNMFPMTKHVETVLKLKRTV